MLTTAGAPGMVWKRRGRLRARLCAPEGRALETENRQVALRAAYARALGDLRAGKAQTAERQLREIQRAAPGELYSLRLLGVALLDQDKFVEAIAILERAVAAAPRFAHARTDLARAYRAAGRLDEARTAVRRVLETDPDLDLAWLAYGDVLVDLGKFPDARFAFARARVTDAHRQRIEDATAALVAGDR